MRSERFTVVYIDGLTKCHCFDLALRLTLTKSTKRKNKQKAEQKQIKNIKKKSENPVFFPNGKMLLNALIQHIKHDQHLLLFFFSSTGHRPASLCHGPLSVVRPCVRASVCPCVNFFFKHLLR